MAEEVVVKEVLTREMIKAGSKLIHYIKQTDLVIDTCFWLYLSESNIWRLIIASPEVKAHGPRKVYQKIQPILSKITDDLNGISLINISVVENDNRQALALRRAMESYEINANGRFVSGVYGGVYIEEAYVYKVS
jgi:hypothetical protein